MAACCLLNFIETGNITWKWNKESCIWTHTHTITIIPTLVSSSKAKPRRKQEETVQRFNRISCIGRATLDQSFPFPHLFLSFPPSPSVLLFLCYWILVSLPERGECVGLVNGITGNIWTYRWQSVFDRIVGRQNNFYRWEGFFFFCQLDVSHRLCKGENWHSKSIGVYCHCCVQFYKLMVK